MNALDRELDLLQYEKDKAIQKIEQQLEQTQTIDNHLTQVRDEYSRIVQLSGQAGYVLDKIDRDFQQKTKLTSSDIILLFLCTALQCARQYLLPNEMFRLQDIKNTNGKLIMSSSKRGDALMKTAYGATVGQVAPRSWEDVLFQSVPYDATRRKGGYLTESTGLSGTTHRYRTLGHDPVLGWIFGTANIMTSALTKYDFETYYIKNMVILNHYRLGVAGMLNDAGNYAQQNPPLLGAAVARQAIHFGSDMFTKQGLPVPIIMTVDNDLAKDMLTKWQINSWCVVQDIGLSALINQLIFFIHRLFYNESKDGSLSMYEVRTRKILSYSNALATGSNVIVVAFTKDLSKLDIGGMLVTLYRLVSDYKFIHEVKRDFLNNEFYKMVVGDHFDFMGSGQNV